ncbi:unnamed protein product [Urochloa humidicola]
MDPEPSGVLAGDRLSKLGDATLGHILSFLPAAEAARAAALSRRWRHVFAAVHTLSFTEEPKRRPADPYDDESRWNSYYSDDDEDCHGSDHRRHCAPRPFADAISAALHGRHRGIHAAPALLRGLCVEFDSGEDAASAKALDGWLHYAVHQAAAAGELHVDLRLGRRPICDRGYVCRGGGATRRGCGLQYAPEARDSPSYAPPRSLLCCATLRSLRLGSCWLNMPAAPALPSLDTLHLTCVSASGGAVQQLISACPCLADLTLEACCDLTKLSIPGARLRRLVLRCCHDLATVDAADSSELQSFEYSGPMPGPTFQIVHLPRRISSCTMDFCGEESTEPNDLASLMEFLQPFANAANLQIKSARLGAGIGHGEMSSTLELPYFHALRHLELTGMLPEDDVATVAALAKMLEQTPILETLSLFFMPDLDEVYSYYSCSNEDVFRIAHKLRYDRYVALAVPEGARVACLREKIREINMVYYQGGTTQRMLAKFLLGNARVVDEVYCEFARGPLVIQNKLMEEITGWVLNKSAKMVFF